MKRRSKCNKCSPYRGNHYGNGHSNDGKRVCPSCEVEKSLSDFYFAHGKKVSGYCKECDKSRVNDRQKRYKTDAVEYKGKKCQVCGYDKCLSAMEFHHVDPAKKKFSIAYVKRGLDYIKEELDKCVLLCCRCHREVEEGIISCPILRSVEGV